MTLKFKTYTLSVASILLLCPVMARAEDGINRLYDPWLGRAAASARNREEATPSTQKTLPLPKMAAANGAAPVMTPDTTRAVLDALGAELTNTPSPLENSYNRRLVDQLSQFGYDMFDDIQKTTQNTEPNAQRSVPDYRAQMPMGAVQDDFILNSGDRLSITWRGQRSITRTYSIDSNGLLLADDMPPITAAGRTIKQVRETLRTHIADQPNTDIYVALEAVQQAGVLVIGNVKHPGRQNMTVFNSVLDALNAAGGVDKTGSLRQIKLVRNGRSTYVDLYALLMYGSTADDMTLRDGDRLIVPPIGPTVAIAGAVKRPGIYEILPAQRGMNYRPQDASEKLSLQEMLDFAGGLLNPGQNRFMKLGLTNDGREVVDDVVNPLLPVFADGGILMVAPSDEMREGTVELVGETRRPGLHALDHAKTLSALLDDEKIFGKDIYPLIGVIERRDEKQMTRKLIDFSPLMVLRGKADKKLQDGDVVHLFARGDILALSDEKTDKADLEQGSAEAGQPIDSLMADFLRERAAFARGAVRQPGAWPVANGTTLENLIAVAGGLTLEAGTDDIELTSKMPAIAGETGIKGAHRQQINYTQNNPATVMVAPGDSVRVNQKFQRVADNSVLIVGEVDHPGRYDLMPGDRLSDLIARAGGINRQAYPEGAIFSRESERRAEEMRFKAQAQDLELKLATALEQKDEPDTTQISAVQELVAQLRHAEAVGRITVEADPGMLQTDPELDILLEAGDRIYIPKRPLTVRVAGEVLSPASLQFRKDRSARDYIMQAGGLTWQADDDRAFVVFPDGSAQPLSVGRWSHNPVFIPPGSTIIVPRDPKPFDFIETARDISQILSNLAITGIFIDDIHNN